MFLKTDRTSIDEGPIIKFPQRYHYSMAGTKRMTNLIGVLLLAAVITSFPFASGSSGWTSSRGGADNSAYREDVPFDSDPGSISMLWEYFAGEEISTTPVGSSGTVLIATIDGLSLGVPS